MKVAPISDVLKHFFKRTTLHGFKYLWSRYYTDRLIWLVGCCASACSAGFLFAVLWARFFQKPAIVTLMDYKTVLNASKGMSLVIICPPPRQIARQVVTHFKQVANESGLTSTLEKIIQKKMADEDQLKMLDKYLDEINMPLPDVLMKYSPECQDMIITCRWQSHLMPCRSLFQKQFTYRGLCCVLDPVRLQNKNTRTLFHDVETTRRLDIALTCDASISYHGCELLPVFYGDEDLVPQMLHQGMSYWFRVSFALTLDNEGSLLNIKDVCEPDPRYSRLVCIAECLETMCGCLDPLRTADSGQELQLPLCHASQLNCLRYTKAYDNSSCVCLPSCTKSTIQMAVETNNLNFMNYTFDPLYNGLNSSVSNVVYFELRLRQSKVFFLLPTETWLTLLSSLGGVFNMFLGVGLFSALEFLFLVIKLPIALKKSAEMKILDAHYH